MTDETLPDAPVVAVPAAEAAKPDKKMDDATPNKPAAASTVITQSPSQYFWSYSMMAYACPEKPAGHVWLRVRQFLGNKSEQQVTGIPPIAPSTSEKGGSLGSHGVSLALWVGMRPSSADSLRTRAARGKEKLNPGDDAQMKAMKDLMSKTYGKSVEQVIADGNYHLIPHDPKALRVVMNPMHRDGKVYVLANPDQDGLCEAITTETDEVWYAPEYRDDTKTRKQEQKSAITTKILQTIDDAQHKVNNARVRPSIWTDYIPVKELTSDARKVRRLVTDYRLTGDVAKLHQALDHLKKTSKEFKDREKFGGSIALDRLIDPSVKFSTNDASSALEALKVRLSHST
jgi:hypothetical protein